MIFVQTPLCLTPLDIEEMVEQEAQKILEFGVIEESNSLRCSAPLPPVLVPKSDGSVCFCIDFCKLNEVSFFDAYPMPWVDVLIDKV